MPPIMNPTVPRRSAHINGTVYTTDTYLSEAAVKARLMAHKPQLGDKTTLGPTLTTSGTLMRKDTKSPEQCLSPKRLSDFFAL